MTMFTLHNLIKGTNQIRKDARRFEIELQQVICFLNLGNPNDLRNSLLWAECEDRGNL